MFGKPGYKAFVSILGQDADGQTIEVLHPEVQISEAVTEMVTTRAGRTIPASFAWFISLREPNPNGAFAGQPPILVLNRENVKFQTPREGYVEGLDVLGAEVLSVEALHARYAAEQAARRIARGPLATATAAVSAEEIEALAAQA